MSYLYVGCRRLKPTSELEYYFQRQWKCKYCDIICEYFNSEEMKKHIKKYHDDEMDFEDHVKAHKDGKCGCSGVEMSV